MTTTKRKTPESKVTPFAKNPPWNIFDGYLGTPRTKQANVEMKKVCDAFLSAHKRVAMKYRNEGMEDSAVRDMVIKYIRKRIW